MISHLGAMISVVNGILLARRLKNISGTVGVASIGDGATSTGAARSLAAGGDIGVRHRPGCGADHHQRRHLDAR